jgi:hypothetical protein
MLAPAAGQPDAFHSVIPGFFVAFMIVNAAL